MKTCSNPQCQKTDLPEEYKFCPKCGTALVTELWQEKYRELSYSHTAHSVVLELFVQFKNERDQLFYILNNDTKCQAEMIAYKNALQIKSVVQFLISFSLFSAAVIISILYAIGTIHFFDFPTFLFMLLILGVCFDIYLFFSWTIPYIWKKNTKMMLINLREFIDKNIMLYKKIFENEDSEDLMEECLKYELNSHEQLSKNIQENIEQIGQYVLDIEANMQAIEEME